MSSLTPCTPPPPLTNTYHLHYVDIMGFNVLGRSTISNSTLFEYPTILTRRKVSPDDATEPRMSFSAAAIWMIEGYAELLDRAEREMALGVVSGGNASLPISAWGTAEQDEPTTTVSRIVLLAPGNGCLSPPGCAVS